MSQYSLHFIRRGLAWITNIYLVMQAVWPHIVLQAIFCHEFLHAVNRCELGGVWSDVHHLHTQAFLKMGELYV